MMRRSPIAGSRPRTASRVTAHMPRTSAQPKVETARPRGEASGGDHEEGRPTTWATRVAMPAPTSSRRGIPRRPKMSAMLSTVFTVITTTAMTMGARVFLLALRPHS